MASCNLKITLRNCPPSPHATQYTPASPDRQSSSSTSCFINEAIEDQPTINQKRNLLRFGSSICSLSGGGKGGVSRYTNSLKHPCILATQRLSQTPSYTNTQKPSISGRRIDLLSSLPHNLLNHNLITVSPLCRSSSFRLSC